MDDLNNNLESAISQFRAEMAIAWVDRKPIIKLFKTQTNYYLYDAGTNRIYLCTPLEYTLLGNLRSLNIRDPFDISLYSCLPEELLISVTNIANLMNENNILKATQIHLQEPNQIDASIQNALGQLILETTEKCNLRCRYCIYNPAFDQKRNHGNQDMSIDVAYRAIDHLANNSSMKERVAISFYGGEPLLCFPFIQECVKYAKKIIPEKMIAYSITTNGTLLSREMASYFEKNDIGVHVSIDGPQDIHDQNRIYPNNLGSYLDVKKAMSNLFDIYKNENKNRISISMVYAPPYSVEKINRIAELWDEPWMPNNINVSFSYCQNSIAPSQWESLGIDYSALTWAINKYLEAYNLGSRPHPLAAQFLEKKLGMMLQRSIFNKNINQTNLNACCLPASRKIFVSVNGTMYLCERVGSSPEIGNVRFGIETEKVKRIYISEYREQSEAKCSSCWCARLCEICYAQAYYNGKFDSRYKNYHCDIQKILNEIYLQLYCMLLEINPNGIDHLSEMKIV